MSRVLARAALWGQALRHPRVLRRTAMIGLPVGLLQVAINQGDRWLGLYLDAALFAKTLLTMGVALSVVLLSAAGAFLDRDAESRETHENAVI